MTYHQRLQAEILAFSQATTWDKAKDEWKLESIYMSQNQTCTCGYHPISEVCVIINEVNKETTEVGNCCVKRFLKLPSETLFAAARRVRADTGRSLGEDTVTFAREKNWISEWEANFYESTGRKRKLSSKQADIRRRINEKFLRRLVRSE